MSITLNVHLTFGTVQNLFFYQSDIIGLDNFELLGSTSKKIALTIEILGRFKLKSAENLEFHFR